MTCPGLKPMKTNDILHFPGCEWLGKGVVQNSVYGGLVKKCVFAKPAVIISTDDKFLPPDICFKHGGNLLILQICSIASVGVRQVWFHLKMVPGNVWML
jgi:hypothetical protein